MNIGNRLLTLASLVDKDAKVFDIGCDHGLLSIYLSDNHQVVATDISHSSILKTKENIDKYNATNIEVIETDGINNLDIKPNDNVIIAGMGTSTILKILTNKSNLPDTLIIQSNKNLEELRFGICNLGYYMDKEILYKDTYTYNMIRFRKGKKSYTDLDYIIGISNNREYLSILLKRYTKIYNDIPNELINKKNKYKDILDKIKTLL